MLTPPDAGDVGRLNAPTLPSLGSVSPLTHEKAARIVERCGYEITGYALTHKGGTRKAIVDGSDIRWFPDAADFGRVMHWKQPAGPGTPPDTAIGDPLLGSAESAEKALSPVVPAASRAVLAAPPSLPLVDTVEEALGVLADELGCVRNDTVPHNAGWFVPGRATTFASAPDAIKALFGSLNAGGTVYVAPPQPKNDARSPARVASAEAAACREQVALF